MSETNAVVAVYKTHSQAERAVKKLQRSGFDRKKMSIVGQDYHNEEHVVAYSVTGDRVKFWGKLGGFWGGLSNLLIAVAATLLVAGCSAWGPSGMTSAQKAATANFNLDKCVNQAPGLFKCPEIDKPICDPTFARNDVDCIRVTANHEFIYQIP